MGGDAGSGLAEFLSANAEGAGANYATFFDRSAFQE